MKNEKNSKVTIICIFIIVLLIIASIGLVLHYSKNNNNSSAILGENNNVVEENNNTFMNTSESNEQITDIDYIEEKMQLFHAWVPYKAEDENGNEIQLNEVWETFQKDKGYLLFSEGDTFSEDIILSNGELHYTGKYSHKGDTINFYTNDGKIIWTAKYIIYKNGEKCIKKKESNDKYVYFKNYISLDDSIIYEELTEEEYNKGDYYFILSRIQKNNDDTFTIYGALYKKEESPYYVVLVPGMYKKITVKSNTPLVNNYPDVDTPLSIIKDLYREDEYNSDRLYLTVHANSEIMLNFKFINGTCVEISTTNLPV